MLLLLTHPKLGYTLMQVINDHQVRLYRYGSELSRCWSYYEEPLQNLNYLDKHITDLYSWTPANKSTHIYFDCSSFEEFLENRPEYFI